MQTSAPATVSAVVTAPVELASDARGVIAQLAKGEWHSILRITSIKGSVRANHYHQHDWHMCYLIKGKIRYVERPVSEPSAPLTEYTITPGQLFTTQPMVAHAMEFLADSEFIVMSPRTGASAEYEHDIIRVTLIDPDEAAARARRS